MAASHTLPHPHAIRQISRLGVLTLYGYGIRVTMQAGHLQIEDGIGPERRKFRLPRVNHRLKRLVCIGDDGFITLSALRWLSDVRASFVMLDRLGKVRVVTGPASPSEARLRRAQALALSNGRAAPIMRELIAAKLNGQETVLRDKLEDVSKANAIASLRENLSTSETIEAIRAIESHAALEYWSAWFDVPVLLPRKDAEPVPTHWLRFGTRHSPLTGGPRLAVNPANALLNYTNAVAESECRLAAVACGLDPGLGFIHTDTANRDSLALDLIETIRPAIVLRKLEAHGTEPHRWTPARTLALSSVLSRGSRRIPCHVSASWRGIPFCGQQVFVANRGIESDLGRHVDGSGCLGEAPQKPVTYKEGKMTQVHDIFVRAYAVATKEKKERKKASRKVEDPKWPEHALVFDTETRITADQSLTFGVYRLCELVGDRYVVMQEGILYADDLSAKDREVLESYQRTAISDVPSFPPEFPLYSRTEFMRRVFWPTIKRAGALVCGLNLPFDLSRLALAWGKGDKNEWSLTM